MLDDLKHGNKFYTGVETDKGVLLFSRNYEGNHQYGAFMEANIERHFFEPDFEGRPLTVYELRGWPSLINRLLKALRTKRCMTFHPHGRITPG